MNLTASNGKYRQGSHKLWKSWKTWKITKKVPCMENGIRKKTLKNHGKIMELVKLFDGTTSSQKTSCWTLVCPTASFLATGGFRF